MTYTIFGESHGPAIGVVLEGVPSGVEMDLDFIRAELQRRAPGKSALTTARKEADEPEILSGVFDGKTTGTPLCAIIRNTDTRSKDYAKLKHLPRPSHADYAGAVRYGGFNDYRGGGHFSGRLTAPLVFAGALAKLILQEKGVIITSAISILEETPDPSPEEIEEIILAARKAGDSVGGAISCTVTGISAGSVSYTHLDDSTPHCCDSPADILRQPRYKFPGRNLHLRQKTLSPAQRWPDREI